MPPERISKVLAAAGVASRRGADELVTAGRVLVDGRPAVLGERVDPTYQAIEVDGAPIGGAETRARPIYLALHKPAGVTSTVRDRHADTTVVDLVPQELARSARLYPVGRLDQDSEGLILLTNDGDWAEHVLHPRYGVEREYAVGLSRMLTRDQAESLETGVELAEGVATLTGLRGQTRTEDRRFDDLLEPPPEMGIVWVRCTIHQGWKRQLRRMFATVGSPVRRLVRVRIGTIRLD
ncbi:MAG: pseudouridine synthase, partial [Candidatus Limnocylindrales bacterium]